MKVQNPTSGPASAQSASTHRSGEAKKARPASSGEVKSPAKEGGSPSMADISARAKEMANARQIAEHAPDTRDARIAELRKKIQDKSYQVDADAVADRMIKEHAEF